MPQKLPVKNFKWIKNASQFNKISKKAIMKKVIQDIFLKLKFNILKNCMNFIMIYHFYQKERNFKKFEGLHLRYMICYTYTKFKAGIR